MNPQSSDSPDSQIAQSDPGDETASRYRYQWCYAAIVCCVLLDDTQDVSEVFCEHHEDILLKHECGTFSGLQVKSRASEQPVWKTSDPALLSAFARFASLESQFPGQFREYRFLTNHPLHSANNAQSITHILKLVREAITIDDMPGIAAGFVKRIADLAACSKEVAFQALKKASASHDLPKLQDAHGRLVSTLTSNWQRANDCTHESVAKAATALIEECGRASSLAHLDVLPGYIEVSNNPEIVERTARINGKRITRDRVLTILEQGLTTTAALICGTDQIESPGQGTKALLNWKLEAGGFSAVSLNSAEDLRNKADYLGIVWTKRYGEVPGLHRYTHVQSLVLRDAADAYEAAKTGGQPFGRQMLQYLRQLLITRFNAGNQVYDCSPEHLEGFAYSLTSQCKIVWSLERPWESE